MNRFGVLVILSVSQLVSAGQMEAAPVAERLAADTQTTTVLGNAFIAPEGWSVAVRGPATILEVPEGDSWIALIDVEAPDGDAALAAGWAAYKDNDRAVKVVTEAPDRDGWSKQRTFQYLTSPNEKRSLFAGVQLAGEVWTVWIYDMAQDVGQKRSAQVSLIFGRLLPKGYARETFAGKRANELDEPRVAALSKFIEDSQKATGVPGVSVGVIQNGKVVLARGFGLRELGSEAKVDADSLYMIASNSKGLTTLLLAKLVDAGKLTWKTPVTELLPSFELGDAETTKRVLVEHLVCACTGLPRQDMEWLLEYDGLTPEGALATLATMQPTTDFGELFQYSNPLAAAGGFVAGHVLHPNLELGAAYDQAMQSMVFDPLGMAHTTFDFERALAGNHASAHSPDIDGNQAHAVFEVNYSVIPLRPAGAGWSSVNDMLKYIEMELAKGTLPDGTRYVSEKSLLERREKKVSIGEDSAYGMGLSVDTTYGVTVVHHGGDMVGYHSDMMWLPEHGAGAVVLTNGDPGWLIRGQFRRKLLEVLFDGRPEADAAVAAASKNFLARRAADRELLEVPADAKAAGQLAVSYANTALGEIAVSRVDEATVFDFGEWSSEVATRHNPDGSVSFITIAPGIGGFEFVVGSEENRSLVLRDAQHEYSFEEKKLE